jgi:hypothetical protein
VPGPSMTVPSRVPYWEFAIVGILSCTLLLGLVWAASQEGNVSASPVPTSTDWELGGGLVTLSTVQDVSATPYWETYCGSPYPQNSCTVPVGVAYVPASNLMVLSEMHTDVGGFSGGTDAIMEFNPDTLQSSPLVRLAGCAPEIPFYPGSGADVFVPCLNATSYASGNLYVVNYQTESIVANVSMPFRAMSMAYDPSNGMIYSGANEDLLATIDPVNDSIVRTTNVTGASFSGTFPTNSYALVFDPVTDRLIGPSATGGLLSIDPATGVGTAVLSIPSTPLTLAVDSARGEIFVATVQPSSLLVLNATTFALEANVSIPDCVDNVCAEPNDVNQVLLDPAHGDAYLVATSALFTLNLSKLAVINALEDYGDGSQVSSAYAPVSDRIFGTYEAFQVGPGFLIQLSHGSFLAVTTLLWLPTNFGTLALAVVVGLVLAVLLGRPVRGPAPHPASGPPVG